VKNLFVGAPLIFAKSLLDEPRLVRAGMAIAFFCLLSSAVYLWNDLVDVERDRLHPTKRHRPIASGALSARTARVAAALLGGVGVGGSLWLSPATGALAGTYLALNIAYSLKLKHVPYVDVLVIAVGFLLRVLSGATTIAVSPSRWLLACTLLLASYLGFGKRAHELGTHGSASRGVLDGYKPAALRAALIATGATTVVAYTLYTLSQHTRAYFGTECMVYTVPCIALGVSRFFQLASHPRAESPTEEMLRDPLFVANLVAWGLLVVAIIYAGSSTAAAAGMHPL
jgi:4-hydroxybenzoate polyprenyltransferase